MRSPGAVTRGFILPNGTVAINGTQHDDIAMNYICDNKLLPKFDSSRYRDPCDFMVMEMSALKVGCNRGNPKVITYVPDFMSAEQWIYIDYYHNIGYKLDEV